MTAREEAAARRAEGMAARADRPRQRRCAPDVGEGMGVVRFRLETAERVSRLSERGGDLEAVRFAGYASVTETPYAMWDFFGEYVETVARDAFDATLAAEPLVEFVVNHGRNGGPPMAHTRNGTLRLSVDEVGLRAEADLDPSRYDVHDLVAAIERGDMAEMSFKFTITDGRWSPEWDEYRIREVDLNRGDVSAVNFGANPHTFIETPARSGAEAEQEARDESPAADAPADDTPATPIEHAEEQLMDERTEVEAAEVVEPTAPEAREVEQLDLVEAFQSRIADLEEQVRTVTAAREAQRMPHYDEVARVGAEARTYRPDEDPRGGQFVRDVITSALGDYAAAERLQSHMREERVERGSQLTRAAGTGAFAGLVVPQYLTDLVAPYARGGRPFADAIRSLPLPPDGMTVNLSKVTTATTTAVQTQGTSVSETDIDDTLISPAVQTIAGSQTVTRQAVERGTGALDVVLEDLGRSYATTLDSTLLNQATNGLTNVATGITWTDNTDPTAAELYPKILQGIAAVEAALVDQDPGDTIVVMHSRRWHWLQAALSSTRPILNQSLLTEQLGANYVERYGSGVRGVIAGVPVIVDNNITTTSGAATNQDEVYIVSGSECFLWEDSDAPMMIRTDTGPSVKSLGVDVVVYGYAAYTFVRRAHAQKIAGTGLVTPVWT